MKGIRWLFGAWLGVFVFYNANALDSDDVARAASRATVQKTSSAVQSRTVPTSTKATTSGTPRNNANAATKFLSRYQIFKTNIISIVNS